MAERKENVVIFPFMAQGHIIPFLALALQIEKRTKYSITFINTPQNIKKLRSSLPKNSSIDLLEIPCDSSDHDLPPNSENCDVLTYHLIIKLLRASMSLEPAFRKIISDIICRNDGEKPLCVISDIFFGWAARVSKEFGIFHAIFSGAGGYGLACYYSAWVNLPHKKVNSDDFLLPDFEEASKFHVSQLPLSMLEADGKDSWSIFQLGGNFPDWVHSDGILFNSVKEFDQLGMMYFKRKLGFSVWSVGPVSLPMENRANSGNSPGVCKGFLDSKPENSVLYVSFGSMNTISKSQMIQLAMALEASGRNFIWVVRPPIGYDVNSEFKSNEFLPQGFEERITNSNKGILVKSWAPQVEILSHKSTSAFLSHCGWNSVLESLIHGVPMLGWPMAAEQFFNSKFLEEELGVCVEVARGKTCEIRYEEMVEKIEVVMNVEAERGGVIRKKVGVIRDMVKNAMKDENGFKGSSVEAMDDFFYAAMSMREKSKTQKEQSTEQWGLI